MENKNSHARIVQSVSSCFSSDGTGNHLAKPQQKADLRHLIHITQHYIPNSLIGRSQAF